MIDRYSEKFCTSILAIVLKHPCTERSSQSVPFRLTRMLVKAMEVAGIEGNFIGTCQRVVTVLRSNKDSVLAMLEAFVHDH